MISWMLFPVPSAFYPRPVWWILAGVGTRGSLAQKCFLQSNVIRVVQCTFQRIIDVVGSGLQCLSASSDWMMYCHGLEFKEHMSSFHNISAGLAKVLKQ